MKIDAEKLKKIIGSMERISKNGQELAQSRIDTEPGQRSQNNNWRFIVQELRDLKKLLMLT